MNTPPQPTITEVTRRNITDAMTVAQYPWSGRLPETEFLGRLYKLNQMPSYDGRHKTAAGDIAQHREFNNDWSDDWILTDARFDLLHAPDEEFLRFLCETVHPVVQPDAGKVDWLLQTVNSQLGKDGWEITPFGQISGKSLYAPRRLLVGASVHTAHVQRVADALSADYLNQQITRMQNSVQSDPELAIGTAKEFIETICKTLLAQRSVKLTGAEDMPRLTRLTLEQLKLTPDTAGNASEPIRVLLMSLGTIAHRLSELRNLHGSGHGKDAASSTLEVRHARLAVGAATTLGTFIVETHDIEKPND
jgi:hypothetical protein